MTVVEATKRAQILRPSRSDGSVARAMNAYLGEAVEEVAIKQGLLLVHHMRKDSKVEQLLPHQCGDLPARAQIGLV